MYPVGIWALVPSVCGIPYLTGIYRQAGTPLLGRYCGRSCLLRRDRRPKMPSIWQVVETNSTTPLLGQPLVRDIDSIIRGVLSVTPCEMQMQPATGVPS